MKPGDLLQNAVCTILVLGEGSVSDATGERYFRCLYCDLACETRVVISVSEGGLTKQFRKVAPVVQA